MSTSTTTILPDAVAGNWVDRHAPERLRPWLKLGRFDRPAGIWLLMLPGWQGIALAAAERGRWPDPLLLLAVFVGAALMRAAGCAFNDIVDRDFDAQVARTAMRPIPAGQISVKQAWMFLVGCSLVSLMILLTLGWVAIGLGVLSLGLVAGYPFMKRITWWPQAWLGLTFNWGALLGYAAATHHLSWSAALLYASGIFWTLGYDTIYAIQDIEDDALAGIKSSTRRLGRHVRLGVAGFYAASFALLIAAAWVGNIGPLFLPLAGAFALHLSRQAAAVRLDDGPGALKLFKSNALAGLMVFAGLVAGFWKPGVSF
ncbi:MULTISPECIES: 4-hydroxybenzoate octaprenyltransferase [Caulobacter]|jgi:4-hydroxybenzoate polyprenyltransferase|uniref:4-hydroxybenzoate octaprenyltransferase n=1 Tax=Caulobacter vibrioides OR37 TaxID=1292034 RepID=R0CVJ7_CAUVI|nr:MULTISPECIES: 4-hydroxybenzoate octaprenyltransferase [Caulobacter]ENZ80385.1 4-hydroxybenzoate polyprenyltransferase [Caulobacter vibrioides OR37]MBQ1562881.1 4-hydroxybenzoate octaprenyltransferase [Caulobacter sp.]